MHPKIITIPFNRFGTTETITPVTIQTVSRRGTNIHLQHVETARKSVNCAIPNETRACGAIECGIGIVVAQESIDTICPAGQYACALKAAKVVVAQIESAPLLISA